MKYLHKIGLKGLFFIAGFGLCNVLNAQDNTKYNWQLGFGVGYTNYYGDVSNYRGLLCRRISWPETWSK